MTRLHFRGLAMALVGLGLSVPSSAQQASEASPTAPAPATANCSSAAHHQFDFWQGRWDVFDQNRPDRPPPESDIELLHDGCVVRETYRAGSYSGTSLSFYDRQAGRWHQTWIDNAGVPLQLDGGLDDQGRMVLSRTLESGAIDRITWTPHADGTVRQHWQRSADDGKSWSDVFDGLYRRRTDG